ncbi:bifunctional folylpolyglutamate synthase/dihydrofolate synthase [Sphingomonas sp.]|uniref:bifunctional folylpolyglutamate synthase/dihydrofolate synthase n=1 Tax=Sphingomonas sp. TaxID=28214 RepID=UPI001D479D0C|nr:bifunctional folylpolyglutamate synthase/dihydrofolate synthase [Sphingomonas sp.]MBX9795576.1 bifunctional folylpolyglutamate synthase/dihydrofolate synthase [Sphingomonas sp.]
MPDHARSTSPAVQAQLDRLWALSPGADILGLDRIERLLARLGDPQHRLPPVFHVAGTNGKGSTCAFLRAALEAAGHRVHAYTSPHLVRFNERIRIAGQLIGDDALAPLLAEVLDAGGDIGASFFEVTTAAAFLAFARNPADACIIEVGLGGRLDATNVIAAPLATGIAQLGLDHQQFLGDTVAAIAAEKAGIARAAVPLVTMDYPPEIVAVVAGVAARAGGAVMAMGRDWSVSADEGAVTYADAQGSLTLPLPRLPGAHQAQNLGLAVAMLRHQQPLNVPEHALAAAALGATWPARMQRLDRGPLLALLPAGSALWLDGGHNPAAAAAISLAARAEARERPLHLVLGMLANKDAPGLLAAFAPVARALHAVPVADHACHPPEELAAAARQAGVAAAAHATVADALRAISAGADPAAPPAVLILGSLYLAGEVLAENGMLPD